MAVLGRSKPLWDDPHSTSGTVATTVIDNVKVIEHAVRRAGGIPSGLTPEQLDMALENLYLILASQSNRGVNLWCLDKVLIPLVPGQKHYKLPVGTVNVQNVAFRIPNSLPYTVVKGPASWTMTLAGKVRSVGVKMLYDAQVNMSLDYMNASQSWKSIKTVSQFMKAGEWLWLDLDPSYDCTGFRFRDIAGTALPVGDVNLCDSFYETHMAPMNRDDYHGLTDKNVPGRPVSYLFDRQIQPILTVWQVPTDPSWVLTAWRQRQPQDVGGALDKLEVPERWKECIIWMLAKTLAYELPNIPADRIQLCEQNAANALREAEADEGDNMPLSILPNISGYTR